MSTPTLAEIDTAISTALYHAGNAAKRYRQVVDSPTSTKRQVETAQNIALDAGQAANAVTALYKGWDRWYLVQNNNGHIHRNGNCSTLFSDTQLAWLPELSGRTEEELVATYGEAVCTICVPDAPVYKGFEDGTSELAAWTSAERIAKNAEKDEKRAKADAEKIVAEVYDSGNHLRSKTFKTERAATNYASSLLGSIALYTKPDSVHPRDEQWIHDLKTVAATGVDLSRTFERQIKNAEKDIRSAAKTAADAKARWGDHANDEATIKADAEAGRDRLIALRDELVR